MSTATEKEQLVLHMAQLDREDVLALCSSLLESGTPEQDIYSAMQQGLSQVSNSYMAGKYFIADLIMADTIFREAMNITIGSSSRFISRNPGRILVGTVQGDVHELGKNLVSLTLQYSGYSVEDLGSNISPQQFLSALLVYAPDVLVLSGSLTESRRMMALTIDAIEKAGMRGFIKIILGGPCVDEQQALSMGADGYSGYPADCLRLCRQFIGGEADI